MMERSVTETLITPLRRPVAVNGTACLVHIYPAGPAIGKRYPLVDKPLLAGRDEDCDIRIPDQSVSRSHARVESSPTGITVTDLGSTNGTFINDRAIKGCAPLRDGDYLRVGGSIYRFLAGGNVEADYHEEIYRLTILDALTQAHNRRAMLEFLERELARSNRHRRPLALLMLDLDRFKSVNDELGHLAGDLALREVSTIIRGLVRREDLFARYGGEEFAVVLTESSEAEALEFAECTRAAVAGRTLVFDGSQFRVTVSIGVCATAGAERLSTQEMIRLADEKLYRAKSEGRNRVAA